MPRRAGTLFNAAEAEALKEMMVAAMDYGTGQPASVQGIVTAGKTGTAQTSSGEDHGWFVGFAPVDDPLVTFVILLEHSGGSARALPIAKEIFEYIRKKI